MTQFKVEHQYCNRCHWQIGSVGHECNDLRVQRLNRKFYERKKGPQQYAGPSHAESSGLKLLFIGFLVIAGLAFILDIVKYVLQNLISHPIWLLLLVVVIAGVLVWRKRSVNR